MFSFQFSTFFRRSALTENLCVYYQFYEYQMFNSVYFVSFCRGCQFWIHGRKKCRFQVPSFRFTVKCFCVFWNNTLKYDVKTIAVKSKTNFFCRKPINSLINSLNFFKFVILKWLHFIYRRGEILKKQHARKTYI